MLINTKFVCIIFFLMRGLNPTPDVEAAIQKAISTKVNPFHTSSDGFLKGQALITPILVPLWWLLINYDYLLCVKLVTKLKFTHYTLTFSTNAWVASIPASHLQVQYSH